MPITHTKRKDESRERAISGTIVHRYITPTASRTNPPYVRSAHTWAVPLFTPLSQTPLCADSFLASESTSIIGKCSFAVVVLDVGDNNWTEEMEGEGRRGETV